MDIKKTLLKDLLKQADISQAEMAKRVGVDATYMSRLARGQINWVNSGHFSKIAVELGLSSEEIRQLRPESVIEFAKGSKDESIDTADTAEYYQHHDVVMKCVYELCEAGLALADRRVHDPALAVDTRLLKKETEIFLVDSAHIRDVKTGDYLFLDKSIASADINGAIYAVYMNGDVELRRARLAGSDMWLFGEGDSPPIKASDANIIGHAHDVYRHIKLA